MHFIDKFHMRDRHGILNPLNLLFLALKKPYQPGYSIQFRSSRMAALFSCCLIKYRFSQTKKPVLSFKVQVLQNVSDKVMS